MSQHNQGETEDVIPSMMHGRPKSELNLGKQGRTVPKGKIFRGTPYNNLKNQVDVKVVQEYQTQLEDNTQVILMQKLEIRYLKEQIVQMAREREQVNDTGYQEMPANEEGFLPSVESKGNLNL